jgi:hypothetical protein
MTRKHRSKSEALSIGTSMSFQCRGSDENLPQYQPDLMSPRTLVNDPSEIYSPNPPKYSPNKVLLETPLPDSPVEVNSNGLVKDYPPIRHLSAETDANWASKLIFQWVNGLLWVSRSRQIFPIQVY